jgi:hypothetical protein
MSLISDFLGILGIHQAIKSARKDEHKLPSHYSDTLSSTDTYCSFDVEDIYDEELDEVIDEEWD